MMWSIFRLRKGARDNLRRIAYLITITAAGVLLIIAKYREVSLNRTGMEDTNPVYAVPSTIQPLYQEDSICYCPVNGVKYDFCYRLPTNEYIHGMPFKCNNADFLDKLGLLEPDRPFKTAEEGSSEPAFVAALSSSHFSASRTLIMHIRRLWPKRPIVVYDLGLDESAATFLKSLCDVELRPFPFENYPNYVQNLQQFRWKPLVIAMMLLEHDTVLYMDTSVQWNNDRLDYLHNRTVCDDEKRRLLPNVGPIVACEKSPILINEFTGHGIFPAMHPDVYKFIRTQMDGLLRTSEHGATAIYVRRTPEATSIIKWWVLCALEEKCMSPPGSQLGCEFGADRYKDYAKCHRFDQAVLNMLLANAYNYEPERYTTGLTGKDLHVERGTSTPKDEMKDFMCDQKSTNI